MIETLVLKAGLTTQGPALSVPLGPSVTVFVGPNNSGKSIALRELNGFCASGQSGAFQVIDKLIFKRSDEQTAASELQELSVPIGYGETIAPDHVGIFGFQGFVQEHLPTYLHARKVGDPQNIAQRYIRHVTKYLDGGSRLGLLHPQTLGDIKRPHTLLARLLAEDPKRALVRKRVFDQLGLYFALDITATPNVAVRLGSSPPSNRAKLRSGDCRVHAEGAPNRSV